VHLVGFIVRKTAKC